MKARMLNQQNKRMLVQCQGHENSVVQAAEASKRAKTADGFDLAAVSDEHFAISESHVDECRREHVGNWMHDKSLQFEREHGDVIEADPKEEWSSSEDEEGPCECVCSAKISRVKVRYAKLREECLALLRKLRAIRMKRGMPCMSWSCESV